MSRRYLFLGGPVDGQFRRAYGDGGREVVAVSPALPGIFAEASITVTDNLSVYYRTRVKFPGWRIFVPVYLISGETIQSLPLIQGYVFPGSVVGRDGDHWPIWPMSDARYLYLEKRQDRIREEYLDEKRRNRDA